jgi:hypothetical protein
MHPIEEGSVMLRPIIAVATAAFLTLAFAPTEASARFGGFRGGGFHGGFHHRGFGFRAFGPAVGFGLGYGLGYPYYSAGYDGCVVPRRIWTPYGWRIRWVNVCY